MIKKLIPNKYKNSIYDIDYDTLFSDGYRALIFDIDNTIASYKMPEPSEKDIGLIMSLMKKGFSVCLFSNNRRERVEIFNKKINTHYVFRAGKPGVSGLTEAMNLLGSENSNTVIIGDQLFTDILCGNRKGIYTILVNPFSSDDELSVRIKRPFEKFMKRIFNLKID